MPNQLLLGIDCGTSNVRMALFDSAGNCYADRKKALVTGETSDQGFAEQNPNAWWENLLQLLQEICNEEVAQSIVGLGLCATCSTLVITDDQLHPLHNAILWMDGRASGEASELQALYPGQSVSPYQAAPKLLWLAHHAPHLLQGSNKVLEAASWLVGKLTGNLWLSSIVAETVWGILPHDLLRHHILGSKYEAFRAEIAKPTAQAGVLQNSVGPLSKIIPPKQTVTVAVGGNDGMHAAFAGDLMSDVPTMVEVGGTSYVLFMQGRNPSGEGVEFCAHPFMSKGCVAYNSLITKDYAISELGHRIQALADTLWESMGVTPQRSVLVGGWANDPLLRNLRAQNLLSKNVQCLTTDMPDYAGCLGAAMSAACACGIYKNMPEACARMHPRLRTA